MELILKRVGAYFVDYAIVSLFVYLILLLPFWNNNDIYQTKYNELISVNEQFTKNELSEEEYKEAFIPIAYVLYKSQWSYVLISTLCFVIYYGYVQYKSGGQTIGKKIFKLKTVSAVNTKLSLQNYVVRTIVLYNILIPILELVVVYTCNVDNYYSIYQNVNLVGYIIMYITVFMIFVRKDGRGLHDILGNTMVLYDAELPSFNPFEKVVYKINDKLKEEDTTNTKKKRKRTKSINKK